MFKWVKEWLADELDTNGGTAEQWGKRAKKVLTAIHNGKVKDHRLMVEDENGAEYEVGAFKVILDSNGGLEEIQDLSGFDQWTIRELALLRDQWKKMK